MTCYYIENAHTENRAYDSYVPVEQMKEILTAAMLQTAIEKFGNGEFTRKQFDELRESFREKKVEKRFSTFCWHYDDSRWEDVDFGESVAPMGFDALKERGIFSVERIEEFDIETEDGIVAGKHNFYKMSTRKAYSVINEMEKDFERKVLSSIRIVKHKVEDLEYQLEYLKEKLKNYKAALEEENKGRLELICDSYKDKWELQGNCEKEFDKYMNAVMGKRAA